jgi:hypothetical protein
MRSVTFSVILLFCAIVCNSQVVFSPKGAEWHYTYRAYNMYTYPANDNNMFVRYERDSLIGTESFKVLRHSAFYTACDGHGNGVTLIKQSGDTIFFRNRYTYHSWQILYNFACQAGEGWMNTISADAYSKPDVTNIFIVDSVKNVTINGITLRRLYIGAYHATERIGWNFMLFRAYKQASCDGPLYSDFLCYQDSAFGVQKFTQKDCDYSASFASVGEEESKKDLVIAPNPASGSFSIVAEQDLRSRVKLELVDCIGKTIRTSECEMSSATMNCGDLERGIYFIIIRSGTEISKVKKVILE